MGILLEALRRLESEGVGRGTPIREHVAAEPYHYVLPLEDASFSSTASLAALEEDANCCCALVDGLVEKLPCESIADDSDRVEMPAWAAEMADPLPVAPLVDVPLPLVWPDPQNALLSVECEGLAARLLAGLEPPRQGVILFSCLGTSELSARVLLEAVPSLARRVDGEILVVDNDGTGQSLSRALKFQRDARADASPHRTTLPRVSVQTLGSADAAEGDRSMCSALIGSREDGLGREMDQSPAPADLGDRWQFVFVDTGTFNLERLNPWLRISRGVCLVVELGKVSYRQVASASRLIVRGGGMPLGSIGVATKREIRD